MTGVPPVKNAVAFIDGQNLYRHAKDAFGHHHPNYDPVKLHSWVCALHGWRPTLVRFYTGIPSFLESPMWSKYWSNRVLSLKRSGVDVTTRKIRYHKETLSTAAGERVVTVPHEKGIDVRIALDIVGMARKRQFDVAVIFSQDSDLNEVVQEVRGIALEQKRSIELASAFPSGPRATSKRGIDKTMWVPIDEAAYKACLDPRDDRSKS